jgi:ribosomal protein S7
MKQNFTQIFKNDGESFLKKMRSKIGLLLIVSSTTSGFAQTIMFDDFNYNGNSDPAITSFNKWEITDGTDGPIYPASYKASNITFGTDPSDGNNVLMNLASSTTNQTSGIVNSRIQTSDYSYFEGTYAARVYFDDAPAINKDGANQTFFSIVDYTLGPDQSKYSEIDFEYLAYDVWGTPSNKNMWVTSYNSYTDTKMEKASLPSIKDYGGWHTLVYSFTDKVHVKWWIDGVFIGQVSVAEDGSGLTVYPRSPMQIAFANWIWYEGNFGLGSSTARRTYNMKVDWVMFYQGAEKTTNEMTSLVSNYKSQGVLRRNLAGQVYQVNTNKAPQVSITSPASGASYNAPATISINASASDPDGSVSKVEFYNGSQLLGVSTAAPYTYNWSNVAAGSYSITAKAYDNLNASTNSQPVKVTVNAVVNKAPTVSITSPASGATYNAPASISINASASDPDGSISKVEFYNGSQLLGISTAAPYSFNWSNVAAGSYSITAKAYDNLNASTNSQAVNVTVNGVVNKAPTVSITSPANGASYNAPASISINASASDPDGTISKVEFYNGSQLLGTSTSAPYSFTWSNVVAGTYSLTAKAYDNLNLSSTSSAVSVVVNNNQNGVVTVYKHCNYSTDGYSVSLPVGNYTLSQLTALGVLNNDVSSVKVQAGYQITLYNDDNFSGSSLTLTADNACLVGNNFNDLTTSLKVSAVSSFSLFIEAESYNNMAGVQTENTSDVGGGLNVGWIDTDDWMAYYNITFPTTGSYLIEYRVASLNGGGRLSDDLNAGSIQLGALDVPSTGGWQNWTTISHTVTVNAGTYNFGVYSQIGGWNLNWIRITKVTPSALAVPTMVTTTDVSSSSVDLYPNPINDRLNLQSQTDLNGANVKVVNASGNVMVNVTHHGEVIDLSSLNSGVYSLIIQTKNGKVITKRFIKN